MQGVRSYKELDVWKKGIEIADLVYEMTQNFPQEERYGLVGQMRRSAVSIASNIAEAERHGSTGLNTGSSASSRLGLVPNSRRS
jgi:hypothetical protein